MNRIRTMVVDDSRHTLQSMCEYLEQLQSIEVVGTAVDGRQAVQESEVLKPDLILMDFQMPGMNGLEAMKKIKTASPSIKVIMVTVHDNALLRDTLMAKGADGFLHKGHFYSRLPEELARLYPRLGAPAS